MAIHDAIGTKAHRSALGLGAARQSSPFLGTGLGLHHLERAKTNY